MAPKVREVNMALKNAVETDGTRRKHPAVAGAKPSVSARSKQMSQAEQALKQELAGKFDYHLAWHQNCVFHLKLDEDGTDLYVFADGSVLDRIEDEHQVVPRGQVLPHLGSTLIDARDAGPCVT